MAQWAKSSDERRELERAAWMRLREAVAEGLNSFARLFQRLVRRRIADAEEGRQAERGAMHHRHASIFQQRVCEGFVAVDHLALGRLLADQLADGRIDIEGAFGLGTFDARGLVQHRHDQVATLLEDLLELRNEILR